MSNKKRYFFIAGVDELRRIISPGDNISHHYLIDRQSNVFSEFTGEKLHQIVTENGI